MHITAIAHYDKTLGKGYFLITDYTDKAWYKGDTPQDAVKNFLIQHDRPADLTGIVIIEEV